MIPHNLLRALIGSRSSNLSGLARSMVYGPDRPFYALNDALIEAGEQIVNFEIGKNYYIETLTKYWVGKVVSLSATEVVLQGAAWIADTGLFTDFLRDGKAQNLEVEIVGDWQIPVALITGASPWKHKLFTSVIR